MLRNFLILLVIFSSAQVDAEENCQVDFYEGLSLEEAESYALVNNFSVKAAEYIARSGAYDRLDAISRWLPSATIDLRRERTDLGLAFNKANVKNWVVSFEERLFSTEVIYNIKINAAESKRLFSELHALLNQTLFDVRVAYYQLIVAKEQERVQKENIDFLNDEFERDLERYKYGESTAFDVHQSQASVANAYTNYYQSLRDIDSARNELLRVMGLPPIDEIELEDDQIQLDKFSYLDHKVKWVEAKSHKIDLEQAKASDSNIYLLSVPSSNIEIFHPKEIKQWTQIAMSRRPELITQRFEIKRRQAEMQQREGEYLPELRLFGSYNDESSKGTIVDQREYWGGGLSLNWLLFDSCGREYRVRSAKNVLKSSIQNYFRLQQETKHDISNTFYLLEQAIQTYLSTKQGVVIAEQALGYAKESRDLGEITPIEYRESVANLTRAKQDFNRSEFALVQAYYNLYRLAGIHHDEDGISWDKYTYCK